MQHSNGRLKLKIAFVSSVIASFCSVFTIQCSRAETLDTDPQFKLGLGAEESTTETSPSNSHDAHDNDRRPASLSSGSTGNKAEWSLHLGGIGIHAPGTVNDRQYNVMPRKIDNTGIGVVAPGVGASYSKNKFGAGFIYLRGDSFGNKALILSTHYNFKTEKNYHLRLHFALYGRQIPIFYTEDRKIDYTMKWSHKTSKYEIFPIVFFNPALRIAGPVWIEAATSYIISYIYLTVKF